MLYLKTHSTHFIYGYMASEYINSFIGTTVAGLLNFREKLPEYKQVSL